MSELPAIPVVPLLPRQRYDLAMALLDHPEWLGCGFTLMRNAGRRRSQGYKTNPTPACTDCTADEPGDDQHAVADCPVRAAAERQADADAKYFRKRPRVRWRRRMATAAERVQLQMGIGDGEDWWLTEPIYVVVLPMGAEAFTQVYVRPASAEAPAPVAGTGAEEGNTSGAVNPADAQVKRTTRDDG